MAKVMLESELNKLELEKTWIERNLDATKDFTKIQRLKARIAEIEMEWKELFSLFEML